MSFILRIDTGQKNVLRETVPEKYMYTGGRGLTAAILHEEVDPTCDPLGSGNKIVFAPGLFGGTPAPCSGRLSVGSKSPLTGGIKEANSGGTAAYKMARLGIKALIIEGEALKDWHYIVINKQGAELVPAGELVNKCNYEVAKELLNKYGKNASIISIGPAGERKYPSATLAVTNREGWPSRHAARGGLGAVLGSKRIKAVVIDDGGCAIPELGDDKKFKEISKRFSKELIEGRKILTQYGTANLVEPMNAIGCLPVRNFSMGFYAKADSISAQKLKSLITQRGGKTGHACQHGCVIRCSNIYLDEKGEYLTSSLEYETIGLLGSNLDIDSLDVIARIDRFCDDFGIDTIEMGAALGVAMEKGILPFGSGDSLLKFLEKEVAGDMLLGRLVCHGASIAGRILGVGRIPAVRGQGLPAYDPRGLKGNGVTYLTSQMGADHTAGNCLPGRTGFRPETSCAVEPKSTFGQVDLSYDLQIMTAVLDVLGFCLFVGCTPQNMDTFAELLSCASGETWDREKVLDLGVKTIKTEIAFNKAAGHRTVENMPEFLIKEGLPPHNHVFDINDEDIKRIWDNLE